MAGEKKGWVVVTHSISAANKLPMFVPVLCGEGEILSAIKLIEKGGQKPQFVITEASLLKMISELAVLRRT